MLGLTSMETAGHLFMSAIAVVVSRSPFVYARGFKMEWWRRIAWRTCAAAIDFQQMPLRARRDAVWRSRGARESMSRSRWLRVVCGPTTHFKKVSQWFVRFSCVLCSSPVSKRATAPDSRLLRDHQHLQIQEKRRTRKGVTSSLQR